MKKLSLSPVTLKLIISFVLIVVAVFIHSCRKDSKIVSPADPAIAQAKAWYESAYPVNNSTNGKTILQSTENRDLSQWIKPDWQHSSKYKKLGKDVIELPIDPSAKFGAAAQIGAWVTNKAYSRSYFLLLNDGKNYTAYIMMVLADSDYVKNDTSKLAHNTYLKNDADFSGKVLYLTPKGEYLGGYAYRNGQLVTPPSATQQTGSQKVQSTDTPTLKPDKMVVNCTDWYLDYYVNGVLEHSEYIGRTCSTSDDGTGSGSGGGSAPPAAPCAAPSPPVQYAVDGSHLTIDFIPPPSPCTPVPVVTQDIIDDLKDACLKFVLENKLKNNNLNGKIANIITDVFGSSDRVNITFKESNEPNNPYPAQTGGTLSTNGIFNATTTLNLAQVGEGSQEYKAIIMVHEILHAYIDYNGPYKTQVQQHKEIAQKYVNDIKLFVQGLYPSLKDNDAYSMILNGIGDLYNNNLQDPNYITLRNSYNISDFSGTFLLQKEGVTGTSCGSDK